VLDDDMEKIGDKLIKADGILMVSLYYFGTPTAQIKKFMDRTRYLKMDNQRLKDKVLGVIYVDIGFSFYLEFKPDYVSGFYGYGYKTSNKRRHDCWNKNGSGSR